ncbi:MAG: LolA family protein, partial [Thalassobaculaceae bacterium]
MPVAPLALLALLWAVSPAAALSADERALVTQVERYLGDLQALAAPFIQVSSAGKMARGRLYLWRPGRLRFEYDPPTPIVIISDGSWVSYRDNEL